MNRLISIGICVSLPAIALFGVLWKTLDLDVLLGLMAVGFTQAIDKAFNSVGFSAVYILPAIFSAIPAYYVAAGIFGFNSWKKYLVLGWIIGFATLLSCAFDGLGLLLVLGALASGALLCFCQSLELKWKNEKNSEGKESNEARQKRYKFLAEFAVCSVLLMGIIWMPISWQVQRTTDLLKKSASYAELTVAEQAVIDAKIDARMTVRGTLSPLEFFDFWLRDEAQFAPNQSDKDGELLLTFASRLNVKCRKIDGEMVVDTYYSNTTNMLVYRVCSMRAGEF